MEFDIARNYVLLKFIENRMNRYLKIDNINVYDDVFDDICEDFKLLVATKLDVGIPEDEAIASAKKLLPEIFKKYSEFDDIHYKEPYIIGGSGKPNERELSDFVFDPNIKESKNIVSGLVLVFIVICLVGIFFDFIWSIIF